MHSLVLDRMGKVAKKERFCWRRIIWLLLMYSFSIFTYEFLKQIQFPCRPSRIDVVTLFYSAIVVGIVSLYKSLHYLSKSKLCASIAQPLPLLLFWNSVRCLRQQFVCTQTANVQHSAVTHNSQFESQTVETWHSTNNTLQK